MTTESAKQNKNLAIIEELLEIANCCIPWGESAVDRDKFIKLVNENFIIKFLEQDALIT